jgi:type VI secretion system secreted protein Hcp
VADDKLLELLLQKARDQQGATPIENSYAMNLEMDGITGESPSSLHPATIDITSFSWGASNTPNPSSPSGQKAGGKTSMTEVTITKGIDRASIPLLKSATTIKSIQGAKIYWSKSTGAKKLEDFMIISLSNVYVRSVRQDSSRHSAGLGAETVTLSFDSVTVDYKVQGKDGLLISAGTMSYNLASGK